MDQIEHFYIQLGNVYDVKAQILERKVKQSSGWCSCQILFCAYCFEINADILYEVMGM